MSSERNDEENIDTTDNTRSPLAGKLLGNILQSKRDMKADDVPNSAELELTVEEPDGIMPDSEPHTNESENKEEYYVTVDQTAQPEDNDSESIKETPVIVETQKEKEVPIPQPTEKKELSRGDIDHEKWEEICDIPHIRKLPRYEGDKMVYISAQTYASIILYASRYANDAIPRNRWNEIYGILIGKIVDGIIFVNRAEPMTVGHSVDVQLGPEHYVFIAQIQDELEASGKGEFMVGWFHSHPGLSLFYSYTDLMNHLNFQTANPDFVGIVFDQTYIKDKPGNPGIVVYRLNDTMMDVNTAEFENNYHEMRYRIIGLNIPFLSNLLLKMSNNYGKGHPLQLSYGERLNPKSIPIKTIVSQDSNKTKITVSSPKLKENQEVQTPTGAKGLNSIPGVPAKSTSKITIKKSEEPKPIEKTEKSLDIKEFNEIKDLNEKGLKYIMEAKKAFYLKNYDLAMRYFKLAFVSFQENGAKSLNTYFKSVNEAIELFIKEENLDLAKELSETLIKMAEENGEMYYLGIGQQFLGEIQIHKGDLENGIESMDQSTVIFSKIEDYAGAGYSNYLIGEVYRKANEWDHSALYYIEAIQNFIKINSFTDIYILRKDVWASPTNIRKMVANIKTILGEVKSKISDEQVLGRITGVLK